jgi:hypothetical protein
MRTTPRRGDELASLWWNETVADSAGARDLIRQTPLLVHEVGFALGIKNTAHGSPSAAGRSSFWLVLPALLFHWFSGAPPRQGSASKRSGRGLLIRNDRRPHILQQTLEFG